MTIFVVRISKEAGVYVTEIEIKAKNEEEAENKAMNLAQKGMVDWEYVDWEGWGEEKPLIQVEEISEI